MCAASGGGVCSVGDQGEAPGTLRWCAITGILIFIIVVIIILVAFHQVDLGTY